MSVQCDPNIFRWLQASGIAKDGKRNGSRVQLSPQISEQLFSGFAIGLLIKPFLLAADAQRKIEAIKDNDTPAIRLYNWNIIVDVLRPYEVVIEMGQRSKIANGDQDALQNLLKQLLVVFQSKRTEQSAGLQVDITEIHKKTASQAVNIFELLVLLISRHFKLSPQHTLNLFLDSNKYLSHLLVKGVKGSFQFVRAFLADTHSHLQFIVTSLFCVDQTLNAQFLMTTLKPCFISLDVETAQLCSKIFLQLYDHYRLISLPITSLKQWTKQQGLNTLFFGFKKHEELSAHIIKFCYLMLEDELFEEFKIVEKSLLWITERERLQFYKVFTTEVEVPILTLFFQSAVNESWNKYFLKNLKKVKDVNETLLFICILETQWHRLGEIFEASQIGLPNSFINFLKTIATSENELLFVESSRTLFSLMQSLGQRKSPFAPYIFKVLASIFNGLTSVQRDFYTANFLSTFKSIISLPGKLVMPSLMKFLDADPSRALLELAILMLSDNRLEEEDAIDLLQMILKVALQDVYYGTTAINLLFEGWSEFGGRNDFLEASSKLALSLFYSTAKTTHKTFDGLQNERTYVEIDRHIGLRNTAAFLRGAIKSSQRVKQSLRKLIMGTFIKVREEASKTGVCELLRGCLEDYQLEEDELQQNLVALSSEIYPKEKAASVVKYKISKTLESEPKILDPSALQPSQFALKDLEKIKLRRHDLQVHQQQTKKLLLQKEERSERLNQVLIERRMVDTIAPGAVDLTYRNIFPFDQGKEGEGKAQLINLDDQEEQAYCRQTQSILKKYRKILRFLFYKYSSSKKQEVRTEEKVHMSEMWKMLKDYEFTALKKQECFHLVKLVNERHKRKLDPQCLSFNGFEDYIIQVSILWAERQGYPHLPPGEQIVLVINQLRKVTKDKAGSVEIYDSPEDAYFQQTDVIREFNRRLEANPDYVLPQNYKKVKQVQLQYEYIVNPMLQSNFGSYVDVLEVLDGLLSERLGFHLIPPLSLMRVRWLAKPVLFSSLNEKLKDYTKGYLQPRNASVSQPKTLPPKRETHPFVQFSLGIKLGVAESAERSIAQEVAYVMNDMLSLIQNGTGKPKKKLVNEAIRRRRAEQHRVETEKRNQEINWKKRAESVKLEVESLREKRKESERAKKKSEYLARKLKKQQQEKILREKLEEFDKMRSKLAEKKQALLDLKTKEEEKIKRDKEEYKKGVEEYFRIKREELLEKEAFLKAKRMEDRAKAEAEEGEKKEMFRRVYVHNLKREADVIDKVETSHERYEEVWDEVKQQVASHRQQLRWLFDLLLKQQKSKISTTSYDELSLGTLNIFCLKFKVIPLLIEKNVLGKLFQYATRHDPEEKKGKPGLNYSKFQEFIFLLSTQFKKIFAKMQHKRKQKLKMIQSLSAQSQDGNHFQAPEIEDSSEEDEGPQQKSTLTDGYLINVEGITSQHFQEIIAFLKLPREKIAMQERFREAMESKNVKPAKLLREEFMATIE